MDLVFEKIKRKIKQNKNAYSVFVLFAGICFIFLLKSPLHPWIGGDTATDSSVFKTEAFIMGKGLIPYRDSFDHKGFLLYLINYIGCQISYYRGVWVLEYIFLLTTVIALYKIALLQNPNRILSILSVLLSLSLLFKYFDGGNLTEEYALPFISVALYIFLDYFLNENISKKRLIICGICFGCVCMLRANMIAVWVVFCIEVLIDTIRSKKYSLLLFFILWFSVGFLLIVIPIILWLGVNNALSDFWFDYIKFNSIYSSSQGGRANIPAKWKTFFTFSNSSIYSIAIICTIFLRKNNKPIKRLYSIYLILLVVNLLFLCISGMTYGHYGMILVPTIVFPIATVLSYIKEKDKEGINLFIIVAALLCIFVINDWETVMSNIGTIYAEKDKEHLSSDIQDIKYIVQYNTNQDDKISVYGNADIFYVVSERIHATKYSYQFPIGWVYTPIMHEYFKQLKEEQPPIIIVQNNYYNETIDEFIKNNEYRLIWGEKDCKDSYTVFLHE